MKPDSGARAPRSQELLEQFRQLMPLIDWYQQNQAILPTEEFELRSGTRVTETATFIRSLDRDVAAILGAPRVAGLLADLRDLKHAVDEQNESSNPFETHA